MNSQAIQSRVRRSVAGRIGSRLAVAGLIIGILLVAFASPVDAQDTVAQSDTEAETLEEVVVEAAAQEGYAAESSYSALKTQTPLIETPQDVSVVTEQIIQEQDPKELQDLYRNTAGIQDSSLNRDFVIRGFRSNNNSSILFDGMRGLPGTFRYHPKTFSMERTEVLKGPSSLLYGTLVPGGVVNLVPKGPKKQRTNKLRFEGDEFEEEYLIGEHTGIVPGYNNLSYRFDWKVGSEESFIDFIDEERLILAPSIRWEPNEHENLTLIGRIISEDQDGRRRRGVPDVEGNFFVLPENYTANEPTDFVNHDVQWLNGKYKNALPNLENLKLQSSFRITHSTTEEEYHEPNEQPTFSDDLIKRTLRDSSDDQNEVFFDAHLNWQPSGYEFIPFTHKVTAGIDYFWNKTESSQAVEFGQGRLEPFTDSQLQGIFGFVPDPGLAPPLQAFAHRVRPDTGRAELTPQEITDIETTQRLGGVYFQDQIQWGNRWKGLFGVRYDDFNEDLTRQDRRPDPDRSFEDDELNFRGGLMYQLQENSQLYISYSESFEPQSLSVQDDPNGPFDPEESEQIEIGHKAKWLKGGLTSTLSGYSITKENVLRGDPNPPVGFGSALIAIGEVESQGIDFELKGNVTEKWGLSATYSFVDAEIQNDQTNPGSVGKPPFIQSDQTASLWTRYEFDLKSPDSFVKTFWIAGGGEWNNTFDNPDFPSEPRPPSFVKLDAAFGLQVYDNFTLQANINNLLDERFVRGGFGGRTGFEPGGPRTVGFQGSLKF